MSIPHLEESKLLKKYCSFLGREGMSKRILHLIGNYTKQYNDEKCISYKDAMILAGHLKAIVIGSRCDSYWDEQVLKGYYKELEIAESTLAHE